MTRAHQWPGSMTLPGHWLCGSVGDHRLQDVDLRGRAGRTDGGQHAGHRGQRDVQRDLGTGDRDGLDPFVLERLRQRQPDADPEGGTAQRRRSARSRPTPSGPWPGPVPRVMPTARSRPSSRVRSKTDSARVLTMPSSAISDRQQQHHRDEGQQLVDEPAGLLLEALLVQHLGVRVVGQGRRDGLLDRPPCRRRRRAVTRPEATSCGPAKAFCSARLITKLSLIQPLPS